MSAETAAAHGPTAGEYIVHHLTHWQNRPMKGVVDFGVVNIDSIFWAVLLGALGALASWLGGASTGKGAARVLFWGALAMAATALIGRLFGATVA